MLIIPGVLQVLFTVLILWGILNCLIEMSSTKPSREIIGHVFLIIYMIVLVLMYGGVR